jgi:predicted Zn-dependent protease
MGRFRQLVTGILLTLALGGCAVNQTDIKGFNLISLDEEKQLGEKFAVEIEKQRPVSTDKELNAYVDRLGRRLLAGAREVEFPFTFKVVVDDSVNAFAIPGGHIYVNTGLIKAASGEEELAAVMAHEINHAVARHGTRQMTQQYGYALVVQLLLGQNQGALTQLAASLFGQAGTMAYSRSMESQADYLGVETMARAGYNPEGMLVFFTKLDKMNSKKPSELAQFFSSHPLTSERIDRVKNAIVQLPPGTTYPGAKDKTEFGRMKGRVK